MKYIDNLIDRLMEKCSGIVAPSLLSVSCDSKVLTWQDNSDNETGFSIERSGDNYIFSEIDTVTAGEVTYTDATADPMTSYFYRIRGFNASGYSAYSNVVICEGAVIAAVKYGALYNWYAATDIRKITSSDDWGVSDHLEFKTLSDYLGGNAAAGGKLKETGFTYWDSPNSGATNEVGLNVKGGGYRKYDDGTFQGLRATFRFWNNGELAGAGRTSWINYDDTTFWTYDGITSYINNKKMGAYIRLFRPATVAEQLLADGTACANYVGNDLKLYRTVKIGTQVWLADSLAETKFRTGEVISEVTDNAAWTALTSAAMCAFNNDWSNV